MRLADFILANLEGILAEWVEFAKTRIAAGRGMTDVALRDDAEDILREVARDMATHQSAEEQRSKSQGTTPAQPEKRDHPAHAHALQRVRSGFEVNQMVAEFRALRATVLRLWSRAAGSATATDLEDVTRFNEAIDQALAESLKLFVGEVDRARSLFLGTLGHDLRTPLSTIATCAAILGMRHPEDDREAGMIQRSAGRMRDLVDVVLAYTRSSLGAMLPVTPKPMRLDELVRHCVKELAVNNETRTIDVQVDGDTQGQWDASRLAQLTSNLVGNALKYGAVDRPVTLTLDGTDPDEVAMQVQNFGEPISAAHIADIFEPLVRGPAPPVEANAGGANMGLGLYIAREVVAAHLGSIRVRSNAAEGTVFDVRLPRNP